MQKLPEITFGKNDSISTENYQYKISELQFTLMNYEIATKKLQLTIYITNYKKIKSFEQIQEEIKWLLMEIIGEINYRKHIKNFDVICCSPKNVQLFV